MRQLPVLRVWGLVFSVCIFLSTPLLAQSPGDTVGYTGPNPHLFYYGENQIELDTSGGLHFAWMNMSNYPSRYIYYNYRMSNGYWLFPGVGSNVPFHFGAGYPELAVLRDGRAMIAAHYAGTGIESVYVASDVYCGIGQFDFFHLRFFSSPYAYIWPRVCVDHSGRVHLLATQTTAPGQLKNIGYRMSSDEGVTWTSLQIAGRTYTINAIFTASEISDKVAIVLASPFDSSQYQQDICYVQSEDGVTWDFENGLVNVTGYELDPDSLRPLGQFDAVYDANDNLHIIWVARQIANGITDSTTYLYHFENGDGRIREVAHRTPQGTPDCRNDLVNSIDQPTIAIQQNTNKAVAAYIGYDPTDCSADSLPNGDVFMQWSDNFGEDWSIPVNITNSQTPGCTDGNCANDVNPSLAQEVSEAAHLFYACDTRQTSRYLYYPIPENRMEVGANGELPSSFSLSQNYPNPFNAVTTIEVNLPTRGHLNLVVYDITGARVATLANDFREAGVYDIKWNAAEVTSGVYFYHAEAGGNAISRKMILLK